LKNEISLVVKENEKLKKLGVIIHSQMSLR